MRRESLTIQSNDSVEFAGGMIVADGKRGKISPHHELGRGAGDGLHVCSSHRAGATTARLSIFHRSIQHKTFLCPARAETSRIFDSAVSQSGHKPVDEPASKAVPNAAAS